MSSLDLRKKLEEKYRDADEIHYNCTQEEFDEVCKAEGWKSGWNDKGTWYEGLGKGNLQGACFFGTWMAWYKPAYRFS